MTSQRRWNLSLAIVATVVSVLAVARLHQAAELAFRGWLFDYRTFFETARCLVTRGCQPYHESSGASPDLMAPLPHVLFMPLLAIGLIPGWAIWLFASACLCVVTARIVVHECRLDWGVAEWCAAAAFACGSSVAMSAVRSGQIYAAMTLPLALAWRSDRRGEKPIFVGLVLGLLVAIKPTLWLFAPWFLRRRHLQSVVAMAAAAAAVIGIGVLVFGSATTVAWIHALGRTAFNGDFSDGSVWQTATRIFEPTRFFEPLIVSKPAEAIFGWVIGSVVFLFALASAEGTDGGWLAVTAGALVISPKGWIYAAPWLVAPAIGVWRSSRTASRVLIATAAALLIGFPETAPRWDQPNRWLTPWLGSLVFWVWLLSWLAGCLSLYDRQRPTASVN